MYASIFTKYLPATNHRGSRIKAWSQAGAVILSWDHGLDAPANHEAAAKAMAEKLGWSGHWFGGTTPDDKGYIFVCALGSKMGVPVPNFVVPTAT